jgi:hypothetical protein
MPHSLYAFVVNDLPGSPEPLQDLIQLILHWIVGPQVHVLAQLMTEELHKQLRVKQFHAADQELRVKQEQSLLKGYQSTLMGGT